MEEPRVENGANCRLVRADGSEWQVTELRGGEHGLRVDAVRVEATPGRLEDELLGRGDRLHWLGEDGDVVWSMKLPMDQARSA